MQPDNPFDDDPGAAPAAAPARRAAPRPAAPPPPASSPATPPPADPLDRLLGLERFGIRPGLDTIRRLTRALGDPQAAYPSIIVAGTNGKGSVAAMIDSALRAAGYRAGRYTSPHLTSLT